MTHNVKKTPRKPGVLGNKAFQLFVFFKKMSTMIVGLNGKMNCSRPSNLPKKANRRSFHKTRSCTRTINSILKKRKNWVVHRLPNTTATMTARIRKMTMNRKCRKVRQNDAKNIKIFVLINKWTSTSHSMHRSLKRIGNSLRKVDLCPLLAFF
jgi:hypothetical protein